MFEYILQIQTVPVNRKNCVRSQESTYHDSFKTSPKFSAKSDLTIAISDRVDTNEGQCYQNSFLFAGAWGSASTSRKIHPNRINGSGDFLFVGTQTLLAP